MNAVSRVLEAFAGKLNPATMQWEGALPSVEVVNRGVAVAARSEIPATKLDRQNAARGILAGYPSTRRWGPEEMAATVKQYADAMEGVFVPVLAELAHPVTSPFGEWPPSAKEIVKAVEAGNARVCAIRFRAKMIERKRASLIAKAEEGEPVSLERRREIMDEIGYTPKATLPAGPGKIAPKPASPEALAAARKGNSRIAAAKADRR